MTNLLDRVVVKLIETLTLNPQTINEPYIRERKENGKSYTRGELATEIKEGTGFGVQTLKDVLNLSLYLLSKEADDAIYALNSIKELNGDVEAAMHADRFDPRKDAVAKIKAHFMEPKKLPNSIKDMMEWSDDKLADFLEVNWSRACVVKNLNDRLFKRIYTVAHDTVIGYTVYKPELYHAIEVPNYEFTFAKI